MQQSSFLGKLLLCWAGLSLVLVVLHGFLPNRTWQWIPTDDLHFGIYADDVFGGASYVERASPNQIHLRCNLRKTTATIEPFCGFHAFLDSSAASNPIDMERYHTAYIDIDYSGDNDNLRFYLRDYEEGYSDPADPINTSKYMSVYIPSETTHERLEIGMNEFTVADWWVNNNRVPRQHALPGRSNVLVFGIDIAFPAALGDHELKVKQVTFEGDWVSAEHWYLGLLLSWIGVIFFGGAIRLYQFNRLTSSLAQEKDQFQELFKTDQLTGLMNRHGLSDYFEQRLLDNTAKQVIGIMFIDIDHFKPINDTFGHSVGDDVLRRVAKCIGDHFRQSDKAARWGGEEFLVLMPGTSADAARLVAERLRKSIEHLVHPELPSISITVSIGVAEIGPGDTFEEALKRADTALYQAKESGRNRVIRLSA